MIRIYRWDPVTRSADCPAIDKLPPTAAAVAKDAVLWIDLEDPTPEEEEHLYRTFLPVHALTFEDITRSRREPDRGAHLPKVEEFPDYLYVVVNPLPWEVCHGLTDTIPPTADPDISAETSLTPKKSAPTSRWNRTQLNGVFTHNVLITHHYHRLTCIETVWGYIGRRGDVAGRGPDYIFHLILDEMVDEYAPVVEQFADRLEKLEIQIFRKPSKKVLGQLLQLKRLVVFMRKTLILEREVLARLTRGEFELVSDREVVYYRNVYDHLVRYTELIEGAREMVSDLLQTHMAAMSNRLSEIMKVLTMISVIILPMSLIAGIYGMNFEALPEFKWHYGYPYALGLMALTAIIGLSIFRWKRWI